MSSYHITDGTGGGYTAKVDKQNRIIVRSINESSEHYVNVSQGQSFSVPVAVTPAGAGNCFFYFKNTNPDAFVVFEGMGFNVSGNEILDVYLRDSGSPGGGTAVTPTNLNTRSNAALQATIQTGVGITGLTQGSKAYRFYVPTSNSTETMNFDQDIILSPQQSITFYAVNGSIAFDGFVDCYLLPLEQ